jgi:hypothetical protein
MGLDVSQLRQDMCTINPDDSDSYANWGRLVKTWVTGVNQFNDGKDYSIPAMKETLRPLGALTRDQFQSALSAAKVDMTIPDRIKRFVFVQDDDTTVIVRLPPKAVVEDIQRMLPASGGQYPLPDFYLFRFWPIEGSGGLTGEGLQRMHCQRIGEYTINTCA